MRRSVHLIAVAFVILMAESVVDAQSPKAKRPRRNPDRISRDLFRLIGDSAIQKELQITQPQINRYIELSREDRKDSYYTLSSKEQGPLEDEHISKHNTLAEELLEPDQLKRLKQLSTQKRSIDAFYDPKFAKEMSLTDKQDEKIIDILQAKSDKSWALLNAPGDNQDVMKKKAQARDEVFKETLQKIDGVLTDEQKKHWEELRGPEFKGKYSF